MMNKISKFSFKPLLKFEKKNISKSSFYQSIDNHSLDSNISLSLHEYINKNLNSTSKGNINVLNNAEELIFSEGLKLLLDKEIFLCKTIDHTKRKELFKQILDTERNSKLFNSGLVLSFDLKATDKNLTELGHYLNNDMYDNFIKSSHLFNSFSDIEKKIFETLVNKYINHINLPFNESDSINHLNFLTQLIKRQHLHPYVVVNNYHYPLVNSNNKLLSPLANFFNKGLINNLNLEKVIFNGRTLIDKDKLFTSPQDITLIDKVILNYGFESNDSVVIKEKQDLKRILDINELTYVDTIKTLIHFKHQIEGIIPFSQGIIYKNSDLSNKIKQGVKVENYTFDDYLIEKYYEGHIKINSDNSLSLAESSKEIFKEVIFPNQIFIDSLTYKQQLAAYYYNNLYVSDVVGFMKNLKRIFGHLASNAKDAKDFDKFPNFVFRSQKELDDYLIDVFTLELNSTHGKENHLNIYEVQDEEIPLSDHLKTFSLITFDELKFAVLVKGLKYKKERNSKGEDETSTSDIVKVKRVFGKKSPNSLSAAELNTQQMIKLNQANLDSVSKSEAVNFVLRANKEIETLYIVSVCNYLKQLEFNYLVCNTIE